MFKDKIKQYQKGIDYLKKRGLNLFVQTTFITGPMIMEFHPGSAFEDAKAETLPKPFTVGFAKFSEKFMDRYKLITQVDIHRLLRICSIILTNFTGPDNEDLNHNHRTRLLNWIKKAPPPYENHIVLAFRALDEIMDYKDELTQEEYFLGAKMLAFTNKLWDVKR